MDRESTLRVLESYRPAQDPMLQVDHEIKGQVSSKRKPVRMVVATDGSAKGAKQTPDGKSFCGWGFSAILEYESGRSGKASKYGRLLNSTPTIAELTAIEEVLKFIDRPTTVEFVVDSANAIAWLNRINDVESLMKEHIARPGHELTRDDKEKFAEMVVVERIKKGLESPLIKGASISWVRAHSLDGLPPTEFPNPRETDTQEERRLVTHLLMNHMADLLANEGARKAVREGVYGLSKTQPESNDRRRVLVTLRKNLFYSYNVRHEAIDFLSKQDPGFLDQDALDALFGEEDQAAIREKRILDEQRMSKQFNDVPADRRDFLIDQERRRRNLLSGLLREVDPRPHSHQPGKGGPSDGPSI